MTTARISDRFFRAAKSPVFVLFAVATLGFVPATAPAAEPKAAFDRAMAKVAKSAQGSAAETTAMEKAIAAARALKPPPAQPDAVVDHLGRAEAAARTAKAPADFLDAAKAFGAASRLAPWVAEYHYNRGVLLEKAERYDDAERALGLYLKAAPQAKDALDVRKRIAGLRYLKEKAARGGATAEEKTAAPAPKPAVSEKERFVRSLEGAFFYNNGEDLTARTTKLMGHSFVGAIRVEGGRIICGMYTPHNPNFKRPEGFFPYKEGQYGVLANVSAKLDGPFVTFCDGGTLCPRGNEQYTPTSWTVIIAKDGQSLKRKRTNCPSCPDYEVMQRH